MLRILRPLRGIETIPSLRKQVSALLKSVVGLVNVAIFLLFLFVLFAIMGLQWFSGAVYYACRTTPEPLPGATVWEKSPLATSAVCSLNGNNEYDSHAGYSCPAGTYCGSPIDYGLTIEDDGVLYNEEIQFGNSSFIHIFDSFFAVF